MEFKKLVWLGVFAGGFIGNYVPTLWGADMFSMSSVILSAIGSFAGIWVLYKLTH
jgi:hypothetical protein